MISGNSLLALRDTMRHPTGEIRCMKSVKTFSLPRNTQKFVFVEGLSCDRRENCRGEIGGVCKNLVNGVGSSDTGSSYLSVDSLYEAMGAPLGTIHVSGRPDNFIDINEKFFKKNRSIMFPVQRESYFPIAMHGCSDINSQYHCDLCICTDTGQGKTLAYLLPISTACKNLIFSPGGVMHLTTRGETLSPVSSSHSSLSSTTSYLSTCIAILVYPSMTLFDQAVNVATRLMGRSHLIMFEDIFGTEMEMSIESSISIIPRILILRAFEFVKISPWIPYLREIRWCVVDEADILLDPKTPGSDRIIKNINDLRNGLTVSENRPEQNEIIPFSIRDLRDSLTNSSRHNIYAGVPLNTTHSTHNLDTHKCSMSDGNRKRVRCLLNPDVLFQYRVQLILVSATLIRDRSALGCLNLVNPLYILGARFRGKVNEKEEQVRTFNDPIVADKTKNCDIGKMRNGFDSIDDSYMVYEGSTKKALELLKRLLIEKLGCESGESSFREISDSRSMDTETGNDKIKYTPKCCQLNRVDKIDFNKQENAPTTNISENCTDIDIAISQGILQNGVLVFSESRKSVKSCSDFLRSEYPEDARKISVIEFSNIKRSHTSLTFSGDSSPVYVSTDALARGVDMPVDLVVNIFSASDHPFDETQYIHRRGRCGRAGKKGECISIVHKSRLDGFLKMLNSIMC